MSIVAWTKVGDKKAMEQTDSVEKKGYIGYIGTWSQEVKLDCIQGVAIEVGTSEEKKWCMKQLWSWGIVHVCSELLW